MKRKRLSAESLLSMVDFPLKRVSTMADGVSIKQRIREKQSEIHRWLVLDAVAIFRNWGYIVNRSCFGVKGLHVASDFGMYKDMFYFVECLSPFAPKEVIEKKKVLNKYAPLWFVLLASDKRKIKELSGWENLLVLPYHKAGIKRRKLFLEDYPSENSYKIRNA